MITVQALVQTKISMDVVVSVITQVVEVQMVFVTVTRCAIRLETVVMIFKTSVAMQVGDNLICYYMYDHIYNGYNHVIMVCTE